MDRIRNLISAASASTAQPPTQARTDARSQAVRPANVGPSGRPPPQGTDGPMPPRTGLAQHTAITITEPLLPDESAPARLAQRILDLDSQPLPSSAAELQRLRQQVAELVDQFHEQSAEDPHVQTGLYQDAMERAQGLYRRAGEAAIQARDSRAQALGNRATAAAVLAGVGGVATTAGIGAHLVDAGRQGAAAALAVVSGTGVIGAMNAILALGNRLEERARRAEPLPADMDAQQEQAAEPAPGEPEGQPHDAV